MRWAFIASIEQVSERFAALSRAVKSGQREVTQRVLRRLQEQVFGGV